MCSLGMALVHGGRKMRISRAFLCLIIVTSAMGCSDSVPAVDSEDGTSRSAAAHLPPAANREPVLLNQSESVITADNVFEAEAFWPNIVAVAEGWQPATTDRPRPKTLQGALIRVERDGRVRLDLARFGRVDVPIAETDLVERANAVRRGEIFKHRGNLAMQLSPLLVRSDLEQPGPYPSREIKSAEQILCVFADPRSDVFPEIAAAVSTWAEKQQIPAVLVAQNVGREDLSDLHGRLKEVGWLAPFVYPERSATQTERLLRKAPSGPWIQLLTREGRVLQSLPLRGEGSLAGLTRSLVVKAES